jgi:hypothetical protein
MSTGKPHAWANEIKAWADEATIEAQTAAGQWIACQSPSWDKGGIYRIKPEPREWWLMIYKDGSIDVRSNPIIPDSKIDLVHVREVLP